MQEVQLILFDTKEKKPTKIHMLIVWDVNQINMPSNESYETLYMATCYFILHDTLAGL